MRVVLKVIPVYQKDMVYLIKNKIKMKKNSSHYLHFHFIDFTVMVEV